MKFKNQNHEQNQGLKHRIAKDERLADGIVIALIAFICICLVVSFIQN